MLDRAAAFTLDPSLLVEACGLRPDEWQRRLLRSTAKRELVLASRQTGKSTCAAFAALHAAIFQAPALVLLLSPSLRQSGELFRRVVEYYPPFADFAPIEAESALRLELRGGSRIVSLPGSEGTVRGFANVALLIIDEGARVEDELYAAVRPMLAVSDGRLICLSTAWGMRGWYWSEWSQGEGWQRTIARASDCSRISPAFLEQERRSLGSWMFRQEWDCEFIAPDGSFFDPEAVRRAISPEIKRCTCEPAPDARTGAAHVQRRVPDRARPRSAPRLHRDRRRRAAWPGNRPRVPRAAYRADAARHELRPGR